MNSTIDRYQALEIMNGKVPFHVGVCTYDAQRQTGGDLIVYGPAVLNRNRKKTKKSNAPDHGVKPNLKRRNNDENETLTIRIVGTSIIKTIHKQLIYQFNGVRVS
jgi:hypothetical protein